MANRCVKVAQYSLKELDENGEPLLIKVWDSEKDASYALSISHISDCCYGKVSKAGGYKWEFYYGGE